jgi:molybdopterin/thiamine biosynthesis adenylyltransferase
VAARRRRGLTEGQVNDRYARQRVLPQVGAEGQSRLAGAALLVVGAGGLGCAVLPYLAGSLSSITIASRNRTCIASRSTA